MGSFLNRLFWCKEKDINKIFIETIIDDDEEELQPFYMQRDWNMRLNAIEDKSIGTVK
jgi:hypothetical protein